MSSFHERQKNLFNLLKDAEDQYSFSKTNKATDSPSYNEIDKQTYKKLKHQMKQFRGKESIYKRQEANIRECLRAKSIPDYIKNPNKWVYYSLSDVTPEQMSDATNTATALALIQKLEEDNKTDMECDEESSDVVFKKPIFHSSITVKKALKSENEKAIFKGNKIVMPEYVVGVSGKREKKEKVVRRASQVNTDKKIELKLNHLYEDDEDS
ncbi:U5 small nuclear ribonucleoprotein TSSC4 [Achroia grisella]|uniref:U5 small nuclear ribonucleoprotein TSSC4 n=1 Tax=Achroia grisella TaxID=688607 RepID=UPI0027D2EAA2|nr:U5 small nuclear ribonucleoprotein TSSC4 [Achroia grisella]